MKVHKFGKEFTLHGLDEVDVLTLVEGMQELIKKYETSLSSHDTCGTMCALSKGQSCSEDLMFIHDQLRRIHRTIFTLEDKK